MGIRQEWGPSVSSKSHQPLPLPRSRSTCCSPSLLDPATQCTEGLKAFSKHKIKHLFENVVCFLFWEEGRINGETTEKGEERNPSVGRSLLPWVWCRLLSADGQDEGLFCAAAVEGGSPLASDSITKDHRWVRIYDLASEARGYLPAPAAESLLETRNARRPCREAAVAAAPRRGCISTAVPCASAATVGEGRRTAPADPGVWETRSLRPLWGSQSRRTPHCLHLDARELSRPEVLALQDLLEPDSRPPVCTPRAYVLPVTLPTPFFPAEFPLVSYRPNPYSPSKLSSNITNKVQPGSRHDEENEEQVVFAKLDGFHVKDYGLL